MHKYQLFIILAFLQALTAIAYAGSILRVTPGKDISHVTYQDAIPGGSNSGWIKRIGVHDPVMIKQEDHYYLFATGNGISVWSSADMQSWKAEKPVFDTAPQWAVDAVPGFKGHIWAPDISYYKGRYYLYYSVSAFGKNTSCIGLATNKTLNPADKDFKWTDHGDVICSTPGADNWNAIDANLIMGEDNIPYLCFGSFWGGLQLVRLTAHLRAPFPGTKPVIIASRKKQDQDAGANPIEAPFIFKKGKYYYLFASISVRLN